jgi:hypothetical protein
MISQEETQDIFNVSCIADVSLQSPTDALAYCLCRLNENRIGHMPIARCYTGNGMAYEAGDYQFGVAQARGD